MNLLFRRTAYDAAGGMPDAPWMDQDLALVLEMLNHGDFFGMNETLVDFRIVDGLASATYGEASLVEKYLHPWPPPQRCRHTAAQRVYGALRAPIMRWVHQLILAAAGPGNHLRTARPATRVLGLSRPVR